MRARQILKRRGASLPPATRDAMLEAFEEAWTIIAPTSGSDPKSIEARRLKSAECVAVVTADVTNVEQIRRMAIHMLRIIQSSRERLHGATETGSQRLLMQACKRGQQHSVRTTLI